MLAVLLIGLFLAKAGELWSTQVKRSNEEELLRIGREFRQAIKAYRLASSPASQPPGYPTRLEDLVKDPRVSFTRRFLRRIYVDPFTHKPVWSLMIRRTAALWASIVRPVENR